MIEIVAATKSNLADEKAVVAALAEMRPDWVVENVKDSGDGWLVRLWKEEKVAGDPPAFLKKKDEGEAPDDSVDDSSDDADDDSDSDTEDDSDNDDSEDGDKKDKGEAKTDDLVSELKDLQSQLQDVLQQVQDKAGEVSNKAEEHKDKLDKAQDLLGDKEEGGPEGMGEMAPPMPGDVGPTPGTKPPMPPRRPGVPAGGPPGGGAGRPGLPSAFTKRRTEIVTHSGTNEKGERISLVAAAAQLESDPEFKDYEVAGMTENADGSFSAKLKLRS